jgi:hypothetical protein
VRVVQSARATDQEWLNAHETTTLHVVATVPTATTSVARLRTIFVVSKGVIVRGMTTADRDGTVRTRLELQQRSWILRWAQGRRFAHAMITPPRWRVGKHGVPRVDVTPGVRVSAIDEHGLLGALHHSESVSDSASTDSTFDLFLR